MVAPGPNGLASAVARELAGLLARTLTPGLYLVATPIGNLGDASLRSLAIIASADRVYCEDTRTSQKLLARFGINRRLLTYHEHNAQAARPDIIEALNGGQSIALISDAGTPAISDPGFKLTRAVLEAGFDVIPVPGPSAAVAAISASGLATDRFLFAGFLPAKQNARRREIAELADIPATIVFYESPHRLAATLKDLTDVLGSRQAVVAREVTKKFEEFRRGSLAELAEWASDVPARGEITLLVGQAEADTSEAVSDEDISVRLKAALETMAPSRAAKQVAEDLGVVRSRVYAIGLELKKGET